MNSFYHIDINYENVFLHDNTGIIFDNMKTRQGFSYASEKVFVKNKPLKTGEFLQFNLRHEKVKETHIYRTYLNLAQVAANIGGILKILMIVFAAVSGYMSL